MSRSDAIYTLKMRASGSFESQLIPTRLHSVTV